MATFDIYEDQEGKYRWRLTSGNDIVADSGEGYSSKSSARSAVENVQSRAGSADVAE